ncbi:hypothetical protein HZA38_06150 [Candidatus Peregrinibacteria bacterium]|nr:hypothetical protein [Candidatus Peregrinibacteria bacterium]
MEKYPRFFIFFAYFFGAIAFVGILMEEKKNTLTLFHLWQALILNTSFALLDVIFYLWYVQNTIRALEAGEPNEFFLKSIFFPLPVGITLLFLVGFFAARGKFFKIPIIGQVAVRMSGYAEVQS